MNTRSDMDEPKEEPKHYVLEVQSAVIRGTSIILGAPAEVEAQEEEKDDGEVSVRRGS